MPHLGHSYFWPCPTTVNPSKATQSRPYDMVFSLSLPRRWDQHSLNPEPWAYTRHARSIRTRTMKFVVQLIPSGSSSLLPPELLVTRAGITYPEYCDSVMYIPETHNQPGEPELNALCQPSNATRCVYPIALRRLCGRHAADNRRFPLILWLNVHDVFFVFFKGYAPWCRINLSSDPKSGSNIFVCMPSWEPEKLF